jgi:hypothetical protein
MQRVNAQARAAQIESFTVACPFEAASTCNKAEGARKHAMRKNMAGLSF